MPRGKGAVITNNFVGGHITEATALNFPENAVVETWNCIYEKDGTVKRRLGLDYEENYTLTTILRSEKVVKEFVWKNVAGTDIIFVCVQIGSFVHFWIVSDGTPVSGGYKSFTVSLGAYKATGAPSLDGVEAEFSQGSGYLFITHPYCEPLYVEYNPVTDTITTHSIILYVRDFDGVEDNMDVEDRIGVPGPNLTAAVAYLESINNEHLYNLYNQGWTSDLIQKYAAGYNYADRTSGTPFTSEYNGTNKTPSNAEVWWLYKDGFDRFNPDLYRSVSRGNAPAPQGHYILKAFYEDRSTASGISGFPVISSEYQRPSTCEFFSGRIFYAGVGYNKYTTKIFFSKIIEKSDDFGVCHQVNDPTSEFSFDILPSDGGVIDIFECGKIIKLFAMENTLIVFASNGVWAITGSQGIGFTAVDYTVRKVSEIETITNTSFTSISGIPLWWNSEGIYSVVVDAATSSVKVQSLTENKNKQFYNDIPEDSKRYAKGYFDTISRMVYYLYRSSIASNITQRYEYDRVLVFNVNTQAFYNFTIPSSFNITVNGITVLQGSSTEEVTDVVTDSSGITVTASSGLNVYVEGLTTISLTPTFKLLVSRYTSLVHRFTFAEFRDETYSDWATVGGTGVDYSSYFVSGFRVHGDAQRKFQTNYIYIFTRNTTPSFYTFRAIWDYSLSSGTHRWSLPQTVSYLPDSYGYVFRRLKIRGTGLSCQFKVESVSGQPFDLVGWTTMETTNSDI